MIHFLPNMRQIVIHKRSVFLLKAGELALNGLKLLIAHVVQIDKAGSRPFDSAQQFVKFQTNDAGFPVLRVLN